MILVTITSRLGDTLYQSSFATLDGAMEYIRGVVAADHRAELAYLRFPERALEDAS